MSAPELIACPACSHPPAWVARPYCFRGVRSGVWMIITAPNCPHMDVNRADNSSPDAEPLAARWNAWATEEAPKVAAARGHTPERATAFLSALQPERYSR